MARPKKQNSQITKDSIEQDILQVINGQFKKNKKGDVVNFLSQEKFQTTNGWLTTGVDLLDMIFSNQVKGGIPLGRITMFTGLQQSGKSYIASHIMKNCQQQNGLAVYYDIEQSVDPRFIQKIGVDTSKLLYINKLSTVEQVFQSIQKLIITYKQKVSKDRPLVIVVDSIAALSTKSQEQGNYDKTGYFDKANLLGKALRKINLSISQHKVGLVLINQLRQKMGAMPFQDPWQIPGGMAVSFFPSLIVRFAQGTKIKHPVTKEQIGYNMIATTSKNRLAPPKRVVEIPIYYLTGINNEQSWYLKLKKDNVIKNNKLTLQNGQFIDFKPSTFYKKMKEDQTIRNYCYKLLCQLMIKKYNYYDVYNDSNNQELTDDQLQQLYQEEQISTEF